MCKCKNVEFGSYDNQMILDIPNIVTLRMNNPERTIRKTVCVDTCLVNEIKYLWSLGIATTGCCCGHNKRDGYIGVEDKFIPRMKELGYNVYFNELYPEREDSFISKTVTDRE